MLSQIIPPQRPFFKKSVLSYADWEFFFTQGYLIVPNLYTPAEVEKIFKSQQKVVTRAKELGEQIPIGQESRIQELGAVFVLGKPAENPNQLQIKRVCGCGSFDPILLQATRAPQLLGVFADLLLSNKMEQIISQFHIKEPHDGVEFFPHRDAEYRLSFDPNWKDINGYGSYVVSVLATEAAGPQNGGLCVVPQSHLHFDVTQLKPARTHFLDEWKTQSICPELKPGDVLFMHPYLVHWSLPNLGTSTRFSLLSGMCSVGANHGVYPGDCTNEVLEI